MVAGRGRTLLGLGQPRLEVQALEDRLARRFPAPVSIRLLGELHVAVVRQGGFSRDAGQLGLERLLRGGVGGVRPALAPLLTQPVAGGSGVVALLDDVATALSALAEGLLVDLEGLAERRRVARHRHLARRRRPVRGLRVDDHLGRDVRVEVEDAVIQCGADAAEVVLRVARLVGDRVGEGGEVASTDRVRADLLAADPDLEGPGV